MNFSKLIHVAVIIIALALSGVVASAQQVSHGNGLHRVASDLVDSMFIMNDGTAPQGNNFWRFQIDGTNASQSATWGIGGLDVPFEGTLKFFIRDSGAGDCWTTARSFYIALHDGDSSIVGETISSCPAPWDNLSLSGISWSGTLSHFDSMTITVGYLWASTTFPQLTIDFDNWRTTVDGQDQLFDQAGDVGNIYGTVWADSNGNSLREPGELPLEGWKLYLTGTVVDSTISDSLGNYQFTNVPQGTYQLSQARPEGWAQTQPAGLNYFTVVLNSSSLFVEANFGNKATSAHAYYVHTGWNLVSVPLMVADYSVQALYANATSPAYPYNGGYTVAETLQNGLGYWIKYAGPQIVFMEGTNVETATVNVTEGWNLVGSITAPIAVVDITSSDPEMVLSQPFKYTGSSYRLVDTVQNGEGYWIKVSKNGDLYMSSQPPLAKAYPVRIVPTDELPPPAPGSSAPPVTNAPTELRLAQNYPNPFNPETHIEFSIPSSEFVKFTVHNVLGQEVAVLVNEGKAAGSYTVTWNGANAPAGVYFYTLQVGANREVKRMLLVK